MIVREQPPCARWGARIYFLPQYSPSANGLSDENCWIQPQRFLAAVLAFAEPAPAPAPSFALHEHWQDPRALAATGLRLGDANCLVFVICY
jgi:hypothetical protein